MDNGRGNNESAHTPAQRRPPLTMRELSPQAVLCGCRLGLELPPASLTPKNNSKSSWAHKYDVDVPRLTLDNGQGRPSNASGASPRAGRQLKVCVKNDIGVCDCGRTAGTCRRRALHLASAIDLSSNTSRSLSIPSKLRMEVLQNHHQERHFGQILLTSCQSDEHRPQQTIDTYYESPTFHVSVASAFFHHYCI
jgi:hypothetical protein